MAYQKQTWITGETITADKLNHMEDGIGNNLEGNNWLTINIVKDNPEDDTMRLDKTAGQIIAAYPYVLIYNEQTQYNCTEYFINFIKYYIYKPWADINNGEYVYEFGSEYHWSCNSLSEYPISTGMK